MRNSEDNIIFPLSFFFLFFFSTKCIQLFLRWHSTWMFVVPGCAPPLCCCLFWKAKTEGIAAEFSPPLLRTSLVLNSLHYLHSNMSRCNQGAGFRQPVTGWLIDYYPEGFASPMSGTGQAPRTTGGLTEDWCLSLSHHHHFFFPTFMGRFSHLNTPAAAAAHLFGLSARTKSVFSGVSIFSPIHSDWIHIYLGGLDSSGQVWMCSGLHRTALWVNMTCSTAASPPPPINPAGISLVFSSGNCWCSATTGQQGNAVSIQTAESCKQPSTWVSRMVRTRAAESCSRDAGVGTKLRSRRRVSLPGCFYSLLVSLTSTPSCCGTMVTSDRRAQLNSCIQPRGFCWDAGHRVRVGRKWKRRKRR